MRSRASARPPLEDRLDDGERHVPEERRVREADVDPDLLVRDPRDVLGPDPVVRREVNSLADRLRYGECGEDPLDDAVDGDDVELGGAVAGEGGRDRADEPGLPAPDGVGLEGVHRLLAPAEGVDRRVHDLRVSAVVARLAVADHDRREELGHAQPLLDERVVRLERGHRLRQLVEVVVEVPREDERALLRDRPLLAPVDVGRLDRDVLDELRAPRVRWRSSANSSALRAPWTFAR